MALPAISFVLLAFTGTDLRFPRQVVGLILYLPGLIAICLSAGMLALAIWQMHILMRPDIRAIFIRRPGGLAAAEQAQRLERIELDEEQA